MHNCYFGSRSQESEIGSSKSFASGIFTVERPTDTGQKRAGYVWRPWDLSSGLRSTVMQSTEQEALVRKGHQRLRMLIDDAV